VERGWNPDRRCPLDEHEIERDEEHEPRPSSPVAQGALICAGLALVGCGAGSLATGSNLWPIAAAFWAVPAVPIAAVIGAITGAATRTLPAPSRSKAHIAVGVLVGIVTAFVILGNP